MEPSPEHHSDIEEVIEESMTEMSRPKKQRKGKQKVKQQRRNPKVECPGTAEVGQTRSGGTHWLRNRIKRKIL